MPQRTNSVVFCFLDKCYSSGLYFGYMKMLCAGNAVYSINNVFCFDLSKYEIL